ncbi:Protein of unknown function (DUF1364) [Frateuria aurantia DSM 6220]|uniref:DUF1364 domain-containing protein n=2 Tax=Frateuria aurantia TaxID=81475 RepID=H8L652_FRAAD|nr:Protein of unknown function (DUF1364) [Frateuria aurantia DSM 6220]
MSAPKMTKARKLAKGQPCMIRIPGICNGNPETTVLAHYRLAGYSGTGMKPPDEMGAWACSACHDVVDGRVRPKYSWISGGDGSLLSSDRFSSGAIKLMHAEGVMRTQQAIREMGR